MEEHIKNKISFKSVKEYYEKEKADLKNNTIRLIGNNYDERKILLNKFVNKEIKPSGMKLVFMKHVKDLQDQGVRATPAKIAREFNMTYRQILNIACVLSENGYIVREFENWTVSYLLTKNGERILLK